VLVEVIMNDLYFNRELSWLKFNERVLEESFDTKNPLFERLKFLSIHSSNFDEFYMVRVGHLFDNISYNYRENKTNMSAKEQIDSINNEVRKLSHLRDKSYFEIMEGFAKNSITYIAFESLKKVEKLAVKEYFKHQVFPLLSPQIIDTRHPFPNLENKTLYIASCLKGKNKTFFGVIPLPHNIDRIFVLPGKKKFLLLEDIILTYANVIFGVYKVQSKAIIRVTRNEAMDIDDDLFEENIDYVKYMSAIIKKRGKLSPVRFEIGDYKSNEIINFFLSNLNLKKSNSFHLSSPLDLSFVCKLEDYLDLENKNRLIFNPLKPQWPKGLEYESIISQILRKDILLCFPFDSMNPFVELIREASRDIYVISIKITLYRIGMQSLIAQYLCDAAENGKEVIVAIELQARFDEQNNIYWSKIMEQAGCKIIYGVKEYKVHSKIVLITRQINLDIKHITHIGTGNYNEKTARMYTDIGLLTANDEIANDAVRFFQNIAIGNIEGVYKHLLVAPIGLKSGIIQLIHKEIEKKKAGKPARIIAKMNGLTDKEVIDSLIEASKAGIKISLIVRGICCLKPGVAMYTDNIEVRSIVGRFLEHSRIYCFGEGEDTKIYISSADMMTRNTTHRVEIATPILDEKIADRLTDMLRIMLQDNVKSRLLKPDGTYIYFENDQQKIDSQMYFYEQAYNN